MFGLVINTSLDANVQENVCNEVLYFGITAGIGFFLRAPGDGCVIMR